MGRPGIMLYFDILEPIRVLPDADKGRLLVAMLEYGKTGVVPEFDGMLALAWGFVKPKIDKDSEEYNRTILKRQFASACRDRKKKGEPDITFEEWLITIGDQKHQMVSSDTKWHPTTTTPATPSTSTTTNTNTAITTAAAATTTETEFAAAAESKNVSFVGGELGKGVVLLSEAQIGDLLDTMGIDAFDYYVDKLANFIIKNDAKVKNHYETILKWWQEDGTVQKRQKPADNIPKGASGVLGEAELDAIQRLMAD